MPPQNQNNNSGANRPAELTNEQTDELLACLTDGRSLLSICEGDEFPSYRTIMRRIQNDPSFKERHDLARRIQAERFVDEIVTIADDGRNDTYTDQDGKKVVDYDNINRARLRVDARKWIAAKMLPAKYGDNNRPEVHVNNTVNNNLVMSEAKRLELIERRARLLGGSENNQQ